MPPSNSSGEKFRTGTRAQITASVPATGSAAAIPGNGVAGEYSAPAAAIAASPSHASVRACAGLRSPARASRPPAANSHARVVGTK